MKRFTLIAALLLTSSVVMAQRAPLPAPPSLGGPATPSPKSLAVTPSVTISTAPPVCVVPPEPVKKAAPAKKAPVGKGRRASVVPEPGPMGPPGPAGPEGPIGPEGRPGDSVTVEKEPEGPNCPMAGGGVKITSKNSTPLFVCDGLPGLIKPPEIVGKAEGVIYPVFGFGYRFVQVWSGGGRPMALAYSPELQLRLVMGKQWELSFGGSFVSGIGPNATLLHASLDAYVIPGVEWLGFSLGVHAQWYGIKDNLARAQVLALAPGLVFLPVRQKHLDVRCEIAGLLGVNGFSGGSGETGAVFAGGHTEACGIGIHFQ